MTVRWLAAAALGGVLACGCSSPAVENVEATAPVPVTVETARIDTLTSTVTVSGSVVPAPGADWTIIAPALGHIAELLKAENDAVKTGDVLVRFDIPSFTAELATKHADVGQATTRVSTAKAKVARLSGLVEKGVAAPRELEEAKQEQAEAEAALSQAQSGVAAAQSAVDRTIVRATFDGVVAKRWHNPGDLVDAASSDPVLRVINPRHLQIVAAVPMSELGRVVVGHAAKVIGPNGGDGVPASVLTKPAQVDPASATADVRLVLAQTSPWPAGTVVQIEIVAQVRDKALVIPTAAIVYEENEIFVMVAGADKRAHKYPVVLGLATHDLTEITVGLEAGAEVIVRGQEGLPDGGAIQVQK
jgi:RND family efflux transporter MFP subunit